MTQDQITAIRSSWALVMPIADKAIRLFYQRLFAIDPTAAQLFEGADMVAQCAKLAEALSLVVAHADRVEALVPTLQSLGKRHCAYGVEDRHYDSVGKALIWTLEQGLGDQFTEEVRTAWTEAYGLVANAMRGAAPATVAA